MGVSVAPKPDACPGLCVVPPALTRVGACTAGLVVISKPGTTDAPLPPATAEAATAAAAAAAAVACCRCNIVNRGLSSVLREAGMLTAGGGSAASEAVDLPDGSDPLRRASEPALSTVVLPAPLLASSSGGFPPTDMRRAEPAASAAAAPLPEASTAAAADGGPALWLRSRSTADNPKSETLRVSLGFAGAAADGAADAPLKGAGPADAERPAPAREVPALALDAAARLLRDPLELSLASASSANTSAEESAPTNSGALAATDVPSSLPAAGRKREAASADLTEPACGGSAVLLSACIAAVPASP